MQYNTNYEDNIFYLARKTRVLEESLSLSLDPDYFGESVHHDILFIAHTSDKIMRSLLDSALIVNKENHLKNLMRLKNNLHKALQVILTEQSQLNQKLTENFEIYREITEKLSYDTNNLKKLLLDENLKPEENKHIISQKEYEYLFFSDEI